MARGSRRPRERSQSSTNNSQQNTPDESQDSTEIPPGTVPESDADAHDIPLPSSSPVGVAVPRPQTDGTAEGTLAFGMTAASGPVPDPAGSGDQSSGSLQMEAQTILDKLQAKRQQDGQLLDDYKMKLEQKIASQVQKATEHIYRMHTERNSSIQPVLQELQSKLTHCRELENDIAQFKEHLNKFHSFVSSQ